jgi:hypothetical protein
VAKKTAKKVVLLIDEYDAPVIDLLQEIDMDRDKEILKKTRNVMRKFYSQIKPADASLHFVFITGVTKFSRMGVFSTLNNIKDISLDSSFGALMGLTQEELEQNLAPFFSGAAKTLKMTEKELLEKVKQYYDGFSFDGETMLYNPFSTLNFFGDKKFANYWMESGSNSLIRNYLRDRELTVEQFSGLEVDSNFAREPGEIDNTPAEGFLYQAGYLSLRKTEGDAYLLDYPNFEVRSSMYRLFMDLMLSNSDEGIMRLGIDLKRHLDTGDLPMVVDNFRRMYRGIHNKDHSKASSKINSADGFAEFIRQTQGEYFYNATLASYLIGCGIFVKPEGPGSIGFSDLEVIYKNKVYVLELKVAGPLKDAAAVAERGLKQIQEKGYGRQYASNPVCISLSVSTEIRNIAACACETGGKTVLWESEELKSALNGKK